MALLNDGDFETMKCTDKDMAFYPGFDLKATKKPFGFQYGEDVFGPEPEIRRLDDIRASLADPARCQELWEDFTP